MLTWLVGNKLADAIAEHVTHIKDAAYVTNGSTRRHGAKGDNLADGIAAVFVFDIVNHAIAIGLAKINVKVGHGHPLRVQETLKQQVVLERIEVGNFQRIGHQGTGTGTPTWAYRAAIFLSPIDEVTHDQEITRETHVQDGVDLKFQTLGVARAFNLTLSGIRVQMHQALFQTVHRQQAEIILDRHRLAIGEGCRVVGQLWLAQNQSQVASLGNFNRVGQGTGHIGKQGLHFGRGLEILIPRELANTALIAQNFAFRNTHPRFMRFVIVFGQKLNGVRSHHRQAQPRSQLDSCHHMGIVFGASCALQFQIKTVRKNRRQLQCNFGSARGVALHQSLTHRPSLRA